MPPPLALTFALIFICIAIYIEHKRSDISDAVVWIVAVWILYSGSKGLGFFLNTQTSIEAGSLPDRYFQLFLGIISIIILYKRKFSFKCVLQKNKIVGLIFIFSLISIAWSSSPGISFRRWGREAIALIIACLIYSERDSMKTLVSAFKRAIYAALPISIVLIKYFSAYGRSYNRWSGEVMWEGITSHKNSLSMLCALSILFIIWFLWKNMENQLYKARLPIIIIDCSMIIFALYLMMGPNKSLTYSATSFLALVSGIICMVTLRITVNKGMKFEKLTYIAAILIIVIGISIPFSGKIPIKTLPRLLNRNETLTERTVIWSSLIPYAKQHMLLGHGFGSFWTTSLRNQISSHAHNGYLDTILDIGAIGLFLFVLFIFAVIKNSLPFMYKENHPSYFFLPLTFIIIVRNISESPLGQFNDYSMWLLLAWSFIMIKKEYIVSTNEKEFQKG